MANSTAPRDDDSASGNRLLLSIRELPTLPDSLADILRVANDPDATIGEMEAVVSRDQSLAARVLQVSNSVLYGSRKIGTLSHAMRLLGMAEVQNIAASMAVSPQFRSVAGGLLDGMRLWRHALGCGLWTQIVAKRLSFFQLEHLYTAGLLHDIGLLVLAKVDSARQTRALKALRDGTATSLTQAEEHEFDTNHARVGAMVCAKWMLPPQLTQLIGSHHALESSMGPAAHVLALAEYLAQASELGEFEWMQAPIAPPEDLLEATHMSEADLATLLGHADTVRVAVDELDRAAS